MINTSKVNRGRNYIETIREITEKDKDGKGRNEGKNVPE
jgi:hypothetical protein